MTDALEELCYCGEEKIVMKTPMPFDGSTITRCDHCDQPCSVKVDFCRRCRAAAPGHYDKPPQIDGPSGPSQWS